MPRALVYGDVDLNLIDGSAIWAASVVEALHAAGCEVTFVLKAPVRTDRLLRPLLGLPGVTIVRRPEGETRGMPVHVAVARLRELDANRHDLVLVRGRRLAAQLSRERRFAGRLWSYLTDIPQSLTDLTEAASRELAGIAHASRYVLCQTEQLRSFLEQTVPAVCGKAFLLPPIVPPVHAQARTANARPRLVYMGKFAPLWNTLEMTALPARLDVELHMIGDKIHEHPAGYARKMRAALDTEGVVWHGGLARDEAMRLAATGDLGLSWRDPELDASLELSTKVLEYGALGLPVVINRTPMHEDLLGADYPLFAATLDDVVAVCKAALADETLRERAAAACVAAARRFDLDSSVRLLRRYLDRAAPATAPRPLKVAVAGHDLKFFTGILADLRSVRNLEVRVDHWHGLNRHDLGRSRELADWADVVVCEWCGPNAVWYSKNHRPGQRLLVRLHRFELYRRWPQRLAIDAVDKVVCVGPHYARLAHEITGWPQDKIVMIPNGVDADQLDRPKLAGAEHTLAMIGIAPWRKRFDLALDVLAELRRDDPRYVLAVKGKLPWEHPWIWRLPDERRAFTEAFERLRADPVLDQGVVFDGFGRDIGAWLRRVGWTLSTSDDESFHMAAAESAASGAVPALLRWPGAADIYDPAWLHDDPAAIARAVAETVEAGRWPEAGERARTWLRTSGYTAEDITRTWLDLITNA
ncbi:glycosyltransferase [Streptosporangiaceae bacterium NEAU-GS5]|nr:glycosyltransferase [Streptosporangiaceae bacterium NEAU-GS5]